MLNIYFITGFMGTGKTTLLSNIHQKVASEENIEMVSIDHLDATLEYLKSNRESYIFIDLDGYIVKSTNRSIAEVFKSDGEINETINSIKMILPKY
mgnify:CR=1 FL=1